MKLLTLSPRDIVEDVHTSFATAVVVRAAPRECEPVITVIARVGRWGSFDELVGDWVARVVDDLDEFILGILAHQVAELGIDFRLEELLWKLGRDVHVAFCGARRCISTWRFGGAGQRVAAFHSFLSSFKESQKKLSGDKHVTENGGMKNFYETIWQAFIKSMDRPVFVSGRSPSDFF